MRFGAVLVAALGAATAQQLHWQLPSAGPSSVRYLSMMPFADLDQDGRRDFLRMVQPMGVGLVVLEVASGHDASTLWTFSGSGRNAAHAGDLDGDGNPDLFVAMGSASQNFIRAVSSAHGAALWEVYGSFSGLFGDRMLGDLDVNGDGRPDLVTMTSHPSESDVYVYDTRGVLLYVLPCLAKARVAVSLAKLGDLDGDGCDDFVIGCNDASDRGLQWVISGRNGDPIRETFGILPGDRTSEHVSSLGDIDGDGVNDYAAFPYWSASRAIAVAYSGGTGVLIRSWADYANSVVTGEDFDQDGINDIVTGADWAVLPPIHYGRTLCHSGRDGSELWRVDVVPFPPGTGSNGSVGWMESSASLGMQPGSPYPVVAWMDINWFMLGTTKGRTRAYGGERSGQGPVTGSACTSSGSLPLIGVRKLGVGGANTGSRITVAKTHSNALAALGVAFTPMPTPADLSPFGFAGCTVYVDPVASFLRVTGLVGIERGYAAVDLPHPLSSAAVGTDAVAQWLIYDAASLAYAATRMHAIRVQ